MLRNSRNGAPQPPPAPPLAGGGSQIAHLF